MNLAQSSISGVKWTGLSSISLAVIAILKISILARFLEKSDFGLMAIVLFVLGFVNLFMDMGLSTAILHKQQISKKEYASLYWLNVMIGFVLFLILLLIAPLIAGFYHYDILKKLIPLMGLSVIIVSFGKQFRTVKQKELDFKTIALIDITSGIFSLTTAVVLAIQHFGVYALIFAALLQYSLQTLAFFIIGLRHYGIRFHFNYNETKPFLKIGAYQVGSQMVNYFNRDLDVMLIGKFFGAELLGGYSLAKQLVFRPAQIINPILTNVASPVLARLQNKIDDLRKNYLKLVNLIFSINLIIYLLIIIFAPLIVRIFYGNQYAHIVNLVRILSVYMLIRSIGNPIGSLITATGQTHREFYWNLFTLSIMPIIIYIGSLFSLEAIAVAITLSMLLLYIPNWYYLVNPLIHISFFEFVKKTIFGKEILHLKNYLLNRKNTK
jgi:PST family polysaccharide transporter/teichuronic acid exporter